MKKDQIKVYVQEVECRQCGQHYSIAHEPNDEGFGHAPVLYECELTREIFYHTQEEARYNSPANEKIIEINSEGKFKVRRTHPVHAICPNCGTKDFEKIEKSKEQFIEAIPMYRME
jgi:rubredoxin